MSPLAAYHDEIVRMIDEGKTPKQMLDHLLIEYGFEASSVAFWKYRQRHGLKMYRCGNKYVLTDAQVVNMRRMFDDGASYERIAERFGVCGATISAYLWRDDDLPSPKRPRKRGLAYRVPPERRLAIKADPRPDRIVAEAHGIHPDSVWRIRRMIVEGAVPHHADG